MTRAETSSRLLLRNALLGFIGLALPLLTGAITIPFVIRGLGTERFGLLSLVWVVLGYFTSLDVGLGRAVTKYVAEALGSGNKDKVARLVWSGIALQGSLGLLGTFVLVLVIPVLVARISSISPALLEEARLTLYALAPAVPIIWISSSFTGVLEAAQRFDLANAVKVAFEPLTFLLPLVGVVWGLGLPGIAALLLLTKIIALLANVRFCLEVFPQLAEFSLDQRSVRSLLSFGGWITVSSLLGPTIKYAERLLLVSFLSATALTFYTVPYEMVSRVVVFPASIALALFPSFSYQSADTHKELKDMFVRPLKYLLFLMTTIMVISVALSEQILATWLGAEFAQSSAAVFRILALSFFVNSLAYVPFAAIHGLGRPDLKAKLDLIEMPLLLVLCWWLIPRLGLVGAGAAKLSVTILDTVCLFWMGMRVSGLRVSDLLSAGVGKALGVSSMFALVTLAFMLGLRAESPHSPLPTWLVLTFLVCAYALAFLKVGIDDKDRAAFRGVQELVLRK